MAMGGASAKPARNWAAQRETAVWAEREPEFTAAGRAGMEMSDMEAMVPWGRLVEFGVSGFRALGGLGGCMVYLRARLRL